MLRRLFVGICAGFLLLTLTGCLALLAAGAGGAGTSVWLSNKLIQTFNAPFDRTIEASEAALKALRLPVNKKSVDQNVAQIMSENSDGKTIWLDVHRVTETSSRVEIRVGAVSSDKEAADRILKRIGKYL